MPVNRFDKLCRRLARLDAAGFLAWQLGAGAGLVFRDWLDPRTTPEPDEEDQTGDLVAALAEGGVGPWWAVPVEFQREPDAAMFGRALQMLGRVWLDLRPPGGRADRFQLGFVIINLTGRGAAARAMEAAGGRLLLKLTPVECNLCDEDAAETLERIAAGQLSRCVLPWVSAMAGGGEWGLVRRWREVAETEPDARLRLSLGAYALILADLGDRRNAWAKVLEDWNVNESRVVAEWIEMGEKRGISKGRAADILELVRLRFSSPLPTDVAARVRGESNLDQLDEWFRAAATAVTLEEFCRTVIA